MLACVASIWEVGIVMHAIMTELDQDLMSQRQLSVASKAIHGSIMALGLTSADISACMHHRHGADASATAVEGPMCRLVMRVPWQHYKHHLLRLKANPLYPSDRGLFILSSPTIARKLMHLTHLDIEIVRHDTELDHLVSACADTHHLRVLHATFRKVSMGPDVIKVDALAGLRGLTGLSLDRQDTDSQHIHGFGHIAHRLTTLTSLKLDFCPAISLMAMTNLRSLHLHTCGMHIGPISAWLDASLTHITTKSAVP